MDKSEGGQIGEREELTYHFVHGIVTTCKQVPRADYPTNLLISFSAETRMLVIGSLAIT